MNVFVAQVSSLYPIDLTGALYASVFDSHAQFRLFISDIAALPTEAERRQYVARSAFPLFQWSYDDARVWRQHHIPLEECLTIKELEEALIKVAETLVNSLTISGEEIMLRAKELAKVASERTRISSAQWKSPWADFAAGIIEEIFLKTTGTQIKVEPYWEIRSGQLQNSLYAASNRLAFERLLLHCLNIHPNYLKFVQGGHIEVLLSENTDEWIRYSSIQFDGETIKFRNESNEVEVSKNSPPHIRFRGPLEILQLQEFGLLVDLPWYSEANLQFQTGSIQEDFSGIEFVSPMSAKNLKRISVGAGGEGFRLKPTGYSLIEFSSPKILRVVSDKLKTHPITIDDLADWRNLINDFPVIAQRVSKHQNSVGAFRNHREIESKRKISNGNLSTVQILSRRFNEINPLMYGKFLLELNALLALMKEWISPLCPNDPPDEILSYLKDLKWINSSGEIISSEISVVLASSVKTTTAWLEKHKWIQGSEYSELEESIFHMNNSSMNLLGNNSMSNLSGLGLAVKVLRNLIDAYYGFASFCCGALFKAHILYPYLLLGPEEFKAEIQNLLIERGKKKYILFNPILWEAQDYK